MAQLNTATQSALGAGLGVAPTRAAQPGSHDGFTDVWNAALATQEAESDVVPTETDPDVDLAISGVTGSDQDPESLLMNPAPIHQSDTGSHNKSTASERADREQHMNGSEPARSPMAQSLNETGMLLTGDPELHAGTATTAAERALHNIVSHVGPVQQTMTLATPALNKIASIMPKPDQADTLKIDAKGRVDHNNPSVEFTRNRSASSVTAVIPTLQMTPAAAIPLPAVLSDDPDKGSALMDDLNVAQSSSSILANQARPQAVHPLQAYAQQTAQQIATATLHSKGGTTEIALNPEELGRVRMALTTNESGVAVSIIAERAETADLMRRNLELLAREFRELGYETVSFTFGDHPDGSNTDADGDDASSERSAPPQFDDQPQQSVVTALLSGGLDLKL